MNKEPSPDVAERQHITRELVRSIHAAMRGEDPEATLRNLVELRRLAEAYPKERSPRQRLAYALRELNKHARIARDLPGSLEYLGELRRLHLTFPAEKRVSSYLVVALAEAAQWATRRTQDEESDLLLDELRKFRTVRAVRHEANRFFVNSLALAAVAARKAHNDARAERLFEQIDGRLRQRVSRDGLRREVATHLQDGYWQALREEQPDAAQAIFDDLQRLRINYPSTDFRRAYAAALGWRLIEASKNEDYEVIRATNQELHLIITSQPADEMLRLQTALVCVGCIRHAKDRPGALGWLRVFAKFMTFLSGSEFEESAWGQTRREIHIWGITEAECDEIRAGALGSD